MTDPELERVVEAWPRLVGAVPTKVSHEDADTSNVPAQVVRQVILAQADEFVILGQGMGVGGE